MYPIISLTIWRRLWPPANTTNISRMKILMLSLTSIWLLSSPPYETSSFTIRPCEAFTISPITTTTTKSFSSTTGILTTRLNVLKQQQESSPSQNLQNNEKDDFVAEQINSFFPSLGFTVFEETERQSQGRVLGPKDMIIYDTTLRDGTQGESVSLSCDDKIKITKRLSTFNINYIEAGWPGSNPKDAEFFHRAQTELPPETRSKLVAFGSTRRKNVNVQDDKQIQALMDSQTPTICLVAKAHEWQVTDIIRATPEENWNMIYDSVQWLTNNGRNVFVDLEHFFDGYKYSSEYALECCRKAVEAGAKGLVLCDTNGGSMPWDVADITAQVVKTFDTVTVGMHAHNDCGMAVANSIIAAKSGAGLIQGTINGIGERTGNADLCSIIPSLALHVQTNMTCNENLNEITKLSRFVDEIVNRKPDSSAPFVGSSAFCHKGGLHVAAMERSPMSYQHVEPSRVGNERRVVISELSGRQNILGKMRDMERMLDNDEDKKGDNDENNDVKQQQSSEESLSKRAAGILNRVKYLESVGYTFEGAEASVDLMILHATKQGYCPPFVVLDYSTQVFDSHVDPAFRDLRYDLNDDNANDVDGKKKRRKKKSATARATVKVRTLAVDDDDQDPDPSLSLSPFIDRLEVSDGCGPVDAIASALKKALTPGHSSIVKDIELIDYKVRILDTESATAAATRVMIEFQNKETEKRWTTVSVDRNVISASLNALVDGFEYALMDDSHLCAIWDEEEYE